jgi:tyrosyl-tRNA synthetase
MDFIAELRWRGLLHDMMPGLPEALAEGPMTAYVGFDPTADSLHIGNLVPIMMLVHWQRAGNRPIALVGGATGRVGDPSGKTAERQLLSEEVLAHNLACQKKQLEQFLDFEGPCAAQVVNNYDWFGGFKFLDFIRDVGKHISINYMLSKDSVKNRMESGMSFAEFSYQLIQGYDFVHLYRQHGCRVQMGGSDQWGNITTGTELIRRMQGGQAYAVTAPLVTKADGSKFGKSEGGNVWLDPAKTSPYKFYQYWLNTADADAGRFLRMFTLLDQTTIESVEVLQAEDPGKRPLQTLLAETLTQSIHGAEALQSAQRASSVLFGRATRDDLQSIAKSDLLSVFEGVPQCEVPRVHFAQPQPIIELLTELTGFLPSKGEARRALSEQSISVNKERVQETAKLGHDDLIQGEYLLLQRGKKQYFVLRVVEERPDSGKTSEHG